MTTDDKTNTDANDEPTIAERLLARKRTTKVSNRATIFALADEIRDALRRKNSRKEIHELLTEEGKIDISYATFRYHLLKLGITADDTQEVPSASVTPKGTAAARAKRARAGRPLSFVSTQDRTDAENEEKARNLMGD